MRKKQAYIYIQQERKNEEKKKKQWANVQLLHITHSVTYNDDRHIAIAMITRIKLSTV